MTYPHPIIAREGWRFIIGSFLVAGLGTLFAGWWALPLWIWSIFVLQFFRDPPRVVPVVALGAVIAPADGRVVAIENAYDAYAQREATKISIFMNIFNVHSNRSPIDGRIQKIEYFPGSFLNADLAKASTHNERNAIVAQSADGSIVTFVQIAGLIARRILCYVKVGDELHRGQRYGFIRFGSRVDVYLPLNAKIKVSLGEQVKATTTVIAEF